MSMARPAAEIEPQAAMLSSNWILPGPSRLSSSKSMRTLSEGSGFVADALVADGLAADGLAADLGISVTHEFARPRGDDESNVLILKFATSRGTDAQPVARTDIEPERTEITRRARQNNHDVIALSTFADIV
jgi:hypothetical protein